MRMPKHTRKEHRWWTHCQAIVPALQPSGSVSRSLYTAEEVNRMQVMIDQEKCIGCGSCSIACAEVFEEDELDGTCRILPPFRIDGNPDIGQVPDELVECVRTAACICAVEAIQLQA
jgi:ferredoxin